MAIAAKNAGVKSLIVPKDNVHEAQLVNGLNIYGFETLQDVSLFLKGEIQYTPNAIETPLLSNFNSTLDFSDVHGQDAMIEYMVIAGTPGCGKSIQHV